MTWFLTFAGLTVHAVGTEQIKDAQQGLRHWTKFRDKLKTSEFRSGVDEWCGQLQQQILAAIERQDRRAAQLSFAATESAEVATIATSAAVSTTVSTKPSARPSLLHWFRTWLM